MNYVIPPLSPQRSDVAGYVASDFGPANVKNTKTVLRLLDLTVTAPGTRINLGLTGEIQLFSDMPVDVTFGDSAISFLAVNQVGFLGRINFISVRRRVVSAAGRLVIYSGVPFLGANWTRENPQLKVALPGGLDGEAWALGTTTFNTINAVAMPSGIASEAHYLISLNAVRSAGTLERVQFIESESGLGLRLFDFSPKIVNNRIEYVAPVPIKLPCAGNFRFIGSNEAAGTTLDHHTLLVGI